MKEWKRTLVIVLVIAGLFAAGAALYVSDACYPWSPCPHEPPASIAFRDSGGTTTVADATWCASNTVKVYVSDSKGNPYKGATVHVSGAGGVDTGGVTDAAGTVTVTFTPKTASASPGLATLTVTATGGGGQTQAALLLKVGSPAPPCP